MTSLRVISAGQWAEGNLLWARPEAEEKGGPLRRRPDAVKMGGRKGEVRT